MIYTILCCTILCYVTLYCYFLFPCFFTSVALYKRFPLKKAAAKVMRANLLLFKTVIAGDSWGEVAVPVIKAGKWHVILDFYSVYDIGHVHFVHMTYSLMYILYRLYTIDLLEAYPGTAVIFVGSLLSLVFGVLNLIVAVVVDTFAEVRESDVMNLAEEMEHAVETDKKLLERSDIDDLMDTILSYRIILCYIVLYHTGLLHIILYHVILCLL